MLNTSLSMTHCVSLTYASSCEQVVFENLALKVWISLAVSNLVMSTYSYSRFWTVACAWILENEFVLILILTNFGSYVLEVIQDFVLYSCKSCVLVLKPETLHLSSHLWQCTHTTSLQHTEEETDNGHIPWYHYNFQLPICEMRKQHQSHNVIYK